MLHSATSGLPGMEGGILWLLQEGDDPVFFVDVHDAEALGLFERRLEAPDRHIRFRVDVLLQHLLVVHLVDVIAREQHDKEADHSSR